MNLGHVSADQGPSAAYAGTALAFRDRLVIEWNKTQQRHTFADQKRVYCMFWMDRELGHVSMLTCCRPFPRVLDGTCSGQCHAQRWHEGYCERSVGRRFWSTRTMTDTCCRWFGRSGISHGGCHRSRERCRSGQRWPRPPRRMLFGFPSDSQLPSLGLCPPLPLRYFPSRDRRRIPSRGSRLLA